LIFLKIIIINKIENNDISWFPINKSMEISEENEEENRDKAKMEVV